MNRHFVRATALVIGAIDLIACLVWSGWKIGVCAGQQLTPDQRHPAYLGYGRGSHCYVSNEVVHADLQIVFGLVIVGAAAVGILLMAHDWSATAARPTD